MIKNTDDAWGLASIILHWLIAALVLTQIGLGWIAATWRLSPTKLDLLVWHKSFGILILLLVLVRAIWRLVNPVPRLPSAMPGWQKVAAHASHFALYALLFTLPLSGWVLNSAANIPFKAFWLLPLPDITGPNEAVADAADLTHLVLFWTLAAVLVVHIGAALDHHFRVRDDVLVKMLPLLRRKR